MLFGGAQSPIPLQLTCQQEYQHWGPGWTQAPVWKEPDNYDYHTQHMFHHNSPHTFFVFKLLTFFFATTFTTCAYRNYYKLISCKWWCLQTWQELVLGANLLSLICTLPVLPLHLGIDCQEVKTIPWPNGGHKNHIPVSLSSAKGQYQSNSHVYRKWMCGVTLVFSFSRYLLHHVRCAKPADLHSLCGELFEEKNLSQKITRLGNGDLLSSHLVYKWREPSSTLSCNKYFILILVPYVKKKKKRSKSAPFLLFH